MIRMAEFPVWLKLQDPPGVIDFRKSYFTFIQRIIIPETNISQVKLNQMYNQATIVVNRVLNVVGEFRIIDKCGICIDQPPEWIFYIRSEERRVGTEWFSTCRSGWYQYH